MLKLIVANLAKGDGDQDVVVAPSEIVADEAAEADDDDGSGDADDDTIFFDGADHKLMQASGIEPWSSRRELVVKSPFSCDIRKFKIKAKYRLPRGRARKLSKRARASLRACAQRELLAAMHYSETGKVMITQSVEHVGKDGDNDSGSDE